MPTITINGQLCDFESGQMILQVALDHGIEIPHYCYHPKLSIVASCRICLAEVWAPNPRNDGKLEPIPKLLPTCQTAAGDGQVVYTNSPKAIANQKAVMEYLLLNHPIDCPVCDQAGECYLQDYSYQYGRAEVRFEEEKIKQPKKDVGPNILLYSDRCIMCTRCVRFCREISGTGELSVQGRGAMEQIDVFPGQGVDNPLASNVIDICPVGALLDKDFLFEQRVWFLKKTPSVDGLTCSGDLLSIEHNHNQIYRIKPRQTHEDNQYWITDEVRYGWKFIHDEQRPNMPRIKGEDPFDPAEVPLAYEAAYANINGNFNKAQRILLMISPMLSCEDAYWWAKYATSFDAEVTFAVGPVPIVGEDQKFLDDYTLYAEKAPNARGVRRVLGKFTSDVLVHDALLASGKNFDAVVLTGHYPPQWVPDSFAKSATLCQDGFTLLVDLAERDLGQPVDVFLPGTSWAEKAGTFENVNNQLQAFERALNPLDYCKSEAQIALDLIAARVGEAPMVFDAAETRLLLADELGLNAFVTDIHVPEPEAPVESDMELIDL